MAAASTTSTMATPASSIATAVATATAAALDEGDLASLAENGECHLLGPFAIIIQGALGALALLSLVWKRWRERPQRPIKIWAFDVSKQVIGTMMIHVLNLLMSMISSGQLGTVPRAGGPDYQANPCSFYLLNLAIDTTIGVGVLYLFLKVLTVGASYTPFGNPPESIISGNYGRPPKVSWWLKQSLIYFGGLLGMKLCVFLFFKMCPWIVYVGDWALKWTEGNEQVQVFFVMLLFPLVMNALQYYIIDSFIKDQKPSDHEPIPSGDEGNEDDTLITSPDTDAWDIGLDSEDEADGAKHPPTFKNAANNRKAKPEELDEYNPQMDGDEAPAAPGSSKDSTRPDSQLLPKKDKPAE